ncbi:hypothetical protein J2Y69_000524 [Microbacterium resistens]|uniref:LysM domain-containing protein n=1 Tax=Microbacterium resistens TaxID=156977 RepID=A0ABU1S8L7_9MICO|nr:hypothetical protein [Microbacterium resistens]MDR6865939.1 hypothetical protein [Microbacterium resistens]
MSNSDRMLHASAAGLALVGALTGCAPTTSDPDVTTAHAVTSTPSPTPTGASGLESDEDPKYLWFTTNAGRMGIPVDSDGDGPCVSNSAIAVTKAEESDPYTAALLGEMQDTGPRVGASGTTTVDAEGHLSTYTVAENDSISGINDRFCTSGIGSIEKRPGWTVQPRDVLTLRPDPTAPVTPIYER